MDNKPPSGLKESSTVLLPDVSGLLYVTGTHPVKWILHRSQSASQPSAWTCRPAAFPCRNRVVKQGKPALLPGFYLPGTVPGEGHEGPMALARRAGTRKVAADS